MVPLGLSVLLAAASTIGATGAACTTPDTPAVVRSLPISLPTMLLVSDQHGTAQLIVTLTPDNALPAKVELAEPSGDAILDAAAVQVARETQFAPETQSCAPVGGRYFYTFEY